MNTQVKIIAAALAAMAAASAQAAPLDSSTTPVVTVYITGASAQKQAYEGAGKNVVCDVPADARWFKSALGDEAFLCEAKAGFSNVNQGDAVLVINRSAGGSAAGVNQILSDGALEAEAEALTLPCGTVTGGTDPATAATLTCTAKQESHAALSDVNANEFEDGVV
ncbi:MAG: hypothetical protein JNM82_08035, partial [Rhodocyclaceae bacterium]|nr:hypothetical protein [Rhodocyclaceae bacterium]